jgi:hypothetical protein
LKDNSTALAAVHVLPGTAASPPDLGFTETGAEVGAAAFWKLPLASDTRPNPTASDKMPAQIRQPLNTPAEFRKALDKDGVAMVFLLEFSLR